MKREIMDIDFNILKECCNNLGIELIPANSNEYITLVDENETEHKVMPCDNLFDTTGKEFTLDVPYNINSVVYDKCKCTTTTNSFTRNLKYENCQQVTYADSINKCSAYKIIAA